MMGRWRWALSDMGRHNLANLRCAINVAKGLLVNKMRLLTHTRLTCTNEMNQGRKTISLTPQACVKGQTVPGSVADELMVWGDNKTTHRQVVTVSRDEHIRAKRTSFCESFQFLFLRSRGSDFTVLFFCFVWSSCCLFFNFHLWVFSSCTEIWHTVIKLTNLRYIGWHIFTCVYSCLTTTQIKTQNIPAAKKGSLYF